MTQVKICGLTRTEDVRLACELGAAYVGFNFSARSARRVTPGAAGELADATAAGVTRVGVFVDESEEAIREAVAGARLDLLQIHRPIPEDELDRFLLPVIAVVRIKRGAESPAIGPIPPKCHAVLFDTAGDSPGGTGKPFDWNLLAGRTWPVPIFLAGGLNARNVAQAISRVHPFAVDVASGVERAPGAKDPALRARFFEAVRQADLAPSPSPSGRGPG